MEQLTNEIHNETEDTKEIIKVEKARADKRASTRAKVDSWDLNIAIFLFLVLILVIILLFQGISIEIIAPVTTLGLSCTWLVGWHRRRNLYKRYYEE